MSNRPVALATLALTAFVRAASAGDAAPVEPAIVMGDEQIMYTWPGFGSLRVQWPLLMLQDGKETKPTDKTVDAAARRATFTYDGGMVMTVEAMPNGQLHHTIANARRDLKTLRVRTTLPNTFMADGGAFAADDKTGAIPKEKAEKAHIFMGVAKRLAVTPADGPSLGFTPMPYTFIELTDNRHWGNNPINMVIFNMPFAPNAKSQTLAMACPADATVAPMAAPSESSASVAAFVMPPAKPIDPGAADGSTVVAKFRDGKDGAFSLGFDDGCDSHLDNALPVLTKYKVPGTFYIYPSAGHFKRDRWAAAADNEFLVLGNHTFQHKAMATVEDIDFQFGECNKVIYALQPALAGKLVVYARPGGMKAEAWKVTNEQLVDGMARHHLLPRDHFVDGRKGPAAVIGQAENALARGQASHIDYHGVGGDWLSVPTADLETVVKRLDELRDRLWLADLGTVMEYARQRDAAEIDVAFEADTLRIAVKTPNDPAHYTNPLTLVTRLPDAWKGRAVELSIRQTGDAAAQAAARAFTRRDDGVVQFDLVPNRETAVFTVGR